MLMGLKSEGRGVGWVGYRWESGNPGAETGTEVLSQDLQGEGSQRAGSALADAPSAF